MMVRIKYETVQKMLQDTDDKNHMLDLCAKQIDKQASDNDALHQVIEDLRVKIEELRAEKELAPIVCDGELEARLIRALDDVKCLKRAFKQENEELVARRKERAELADAGIAPPYGVVLGPHCVWLGRVTVFEGAQCNAN